MNKILVKIFSTLLRRKLIVKDDGTKEVKWYQSENILSGVAVALYGLYTLAQKLSPNFGYQPLPDIPESVLGTVSTLLGGTIVWSRWTAEAKVVK